MEQINEIKNFVSNPILDKIVSETEKLIVKKEDNKNEKIIENY